MLTKISRLSTQKKNKSKIVCLTAYSKNIAEEIDKYADLILVGDSLGSVLYNYDTTRKVTLKMMIEHSKSVRKGVKKSLMIVDMPFNTYRNIKEAKKNVKKVLLKTNCDAIKLESNGKNFKLLKTLTNSGIKVMGHIGYTPQYKKNFSPQGLKHREEIKLMNEAKNIEDAGAFAIVLECINAGLAKKITKNLQIPTIGIGSSKYCNGQILVLDDLIGLSGFYPKFVKKYISLEKILNKAIKKFRNDVIKNNFPKVSNTY